MTKILDDPVRILLSDAERDTGDLTDEHMFDIIDAFHREGFVVLENAIPVEIIDKLNERMLRDNKEALSDKAAMVYWNQGKDKGNMSQVPPIERGWLFPEIYANKPVGAIVNNILGPKPELRYMRSNTLIGDVPTRQNVHKDIKMQHISSPFAVAFNTCLVDVTTENGSTELWLGSHCSSWHDFKDLPKGWISDERIEERRKIRPPIQPNIKRGSIMLRDLRLWHSGMPNYTPDVRVMLSFTYLARWYKSNLLQPLPEVLKPEFEALGASNNTQIIGNWIPGEHDHLTVPMYSSFISGIAPEKRGQPVGPPLVTP